MWVQGKRVPHVRQLREIVLQWGETDDLGGKENNADAKSLSRCWLQWASPGGSDGRESAYNREDPALIPGSGRSPRERNGYPLQDSCWRRPWTEEPDGLQSMGLQRVRHDWVTNTISLSRKQEVHTNNKKEGIHGCRCWICGKQNDGSRWIFFIASINIFSV